MTVSPRRINLFQFTVAVGLLSFSTAGFSSEDKIIYQCPEASAVQFTKPNEQEKQNGWLWHASVNLVNVHGGREDINMSAPSRVDSYPPFFGMTVTNQSDQLIFVRCAYYDSQHTPMVEGYKVLGTSGSVPGADKYCTVGGESITRPHENNTDVSLVKDCVGTAAHCQLVCSER